MAIEIEWAITNKILENAADRLTTILDEWDKGQSHTPHMEALQTLALLAITERLTVIARLLSELDVPRRP